MSQLARNCFFNFGFTPPTTERLEAVRCLVPPRAGPQQASSQGLFKRRDNPLTEARTEVTCAVATVLYNLELSLKGHFCGQCLSLQQQNKETETQSYKIRREAEAMN